MPVQVLVPDTALSLDEWTSFGGAASKIEAISDDLDSTYLQGGTDDPGSVDVHGLVAMATYVLAAGERVKQALVQSRVGLASTSGSTTNNYWTRIESSESPAGSSTYDKHSLDGSGGSTFETVNGAYRTGIVEVEGDQQALIDDLDVRFVAKKDNTLWVAEIRVLLDVWERTVAPTVTSSPSGTITDTDVPVIESYVSDRGDGAPSTYSHQIRVFRDAVYLAGGFDPETETDVEWEYLDDSHTTPPTDHRTPDEVQVGEPLANADTYRAYVRYGKNDVAGATLWSEWGHVEFTLNLTLPTAPGVVVTVDEANGRQTVEVTTAALTHDTLESIRVERSDDGGTTWATIRGGYTTEEPDGDPLAGSTAYTFHDYDAPRATSVTYRARVAEGLTASGTTITSNWTTAAAVEHTNDGTWWLYDVDQWTAVLADARITGLPEIEVAADVGVFYPLGRDGSAVVVSGTVHGDDGTYTLRGTGTVECAAVDAIARYAGTVLVKSPFGDQKYVAWTVRSMQLAGTPAQPRHTWMLEYAEVDSGIGADG